MPYFLLGKKKIISWKLLRLFTFITFGPMAFQIRHLRTRNNNIRDGERKKRAKQSKRGRLEVLGRREG